MRHYDAIVLGIGGVGSAALYQLARRGLSVLGLEQFGVAHDRGSSHGQTRIIRQAYFEHPHYVPLVQRAYELWRELEDDCGERLYQEVGLLQVGPSDGVVLSGVRRSAAEHRLDIQELSGTDVETEFPGFAAPSPWCGIFERRAGYLRVEACVAAHIAAARRQGAELKTDERVVDWQAADGGVEVRTQRETYRAGRLVIAAGAWSVPLLADLGVRLVVLRKPLFWWQPADQMYDVERGCPTFLYQTEQGCFYGFPRCDRQGVKVAEHTGGNLVSDPALVDRQLDLADQVRVADFCRLAMPRLGGQLLAHAVCLYTMSPDEHFIVDRHPTLPQVVFAAGLSGHGFKFTPLLGEVLADLATDGQSSQPIGFLALDRAGLRAAP